MLLGHVYCSRQEKGMTELETGTLFIRSKVLEETDDHISRLSIRCNLNGEQHYRVGRNEYLINPKNYLIINQGQHYRTSFYGEEEQEMILVAFKPGFAEQLLYSRVTPQHILLDDPFKSPGQALELFEKTYPQDAVIQNLFDRLRKLIDLDNGIKMEIDLEDIYSALMLRMLEVHRNLQGEINKLGSIKLSTRQELFKRLSIAKDYMAAHPDRNIKLDEVAKVACLSVHHFKREFKELYGVSPHRFLLNKRIEKAEEMLSRTALQVEEISLATGFTNTSSFIRSFKAQKGKTPGTYRK